MKQSSSTAWPASGPDCKPTETLTSVQGYRGIAAVPVRLSLKIDEIRDRWEKDAMKKAFAIGDRVTVKNATTTFYTRNQAFISGKTGVIVEHRPDWVIPEDEAIGRGTPERGGRMEPFYVVRFNQIDLWPDYTGSDADTLETQIAQGWLQPAGEESL